MVDSNLLGYQSFGVNYWLSCGLVVCRAVLTRKETSTTLQPETNSQTLLLSFWSLVAPTK